MAPPAGQQIHNSVGLIVLRLRDETSKMAGWSLAPFGGGMPLFNGNFGESPDDHVTHFERYCLALSKEGPEQFPRRF